MQWSQLAVALDRFEVSVVLVHELSKGFVRFTNFRFHKKDVVVVDIYVKRVDYRSVNFIKNYLGQFFVSPRRHGDDQYVIGHSICGWFRWECLNRIRLNQENSQRYARCKRSPK
jgi:hypothetical protein